MNAEKKIKTFEELCQIVSKLKAKGEKVVQCHGVFDIIHPGIVRHVESAKRQGSTLVATVIKDKDVHKGPNYPIFGEKLRAGNIASIGCIDYVSIVNDNPHLQCVKALKPDIFAQGQDYKDRDQTIKKKLEYEQKSLEIAGCKIHYTPGEVFSSTSIINQFLDVYPEKTKRYLKNLKKKYNAGDIIKSIEGLRNLKVLIIGDVIIDEYHYCEALGKSTKDPLVVNKYISDESFAGGAAAVANHVSSICNEVQLVSVLGDNDSKKDFLLSKLRPNIKPKFFFCKDTSTIVKRRFINQPLNQKMFEICYIKNDEIPKRYEKRISDYLIKQIPKFDLIMVSDFGHGLITKKLIHLIENKAKKLAVNVQTNGANAGFNMVTKYHKVNFTCLDEPEARLACQDRLGDIRNLARMITKRTNTDYLIVTRGKNGSIGVDSKSRFNETPAFSSMVIDRIGAGDAFFSFTAPCFGRGLALDLVSFIGNTVGAIAVQIVCNREPIEPKKLFEFIHTLLR